MIFFDPGCVHDIRPNSGSSVEHAGAQSSVGSGSATGHLPTHATSRILALATPENASALRNLEARPLQGRAVHDPSTRDRFWVLSARGFPLEPVLARIRGFAGEGYRSGYGVAPSAWAIETASSIASMLAKSCLTEPRVVPIADGGIGLVFSHRGRMARVDVTNDEEIVLTKRLASNVPAEYLEVTRDDVARLVTEIFT